MAMAPLKCCTARASTALRAGWTLPSPSCPPSLCAMASSSSSSREHRECLGLTASPEDGQQTRDHTKPAWRNGADIGHLLRQAFQRSGNGAENLVGVSRVVTRHLGDLNVGTMTSAINLLARSARAVEPQRKLISAELSEIREAIGLLEGRITGAAPTILDARGLALCSHGLANLSSLRSCPRALGAISSAVVGRAHELEADQLAMIASAFAKAEYDAPRLFEAVRAEAIPRLGAFSAQGLSSLAHAFAKSQPALNEPACFLFRAIEKEASSRLPEFGPQGLSNLTWALVKSGTYSKHFLWQVKDAALPIIGGFGPREITIMLGSFATAGALPALRSLLRCTQGDMEENRPGLVTAFSPQGLSTYAWAAAKAKISMPGLSRLVAAEVLRRDSKQFHNQDLIRLAWSFAEGQSIHELALSKVLAEMLRRFQSLKQSELLGILMTLAAMRAPPQDLSEAVADKVLTSLSTYSPLELCNIVWACGRLEQQVPGLSDRSSLRCSAAMASGYHTAAELAAAAHATRHSRVPTKWTLQILCGPQFDTNWLGKMDPGQVVQLLCTSARAGYYSENLLEQATASLIPQLRTCPVSLLPVLAWSVAKLSFYDNRLMETIQSICVERVEAMTASQMAMLAHAYATLAHGTSARLVTSISRHAALAPDSFSVLEISQLLWSQAVLQCLDGRSLPSLAASLSRRQEQLQDCHLVMLFQVHLAGLTTTEPLARLSLPPDLLCRAEAAWGCLAHQNRFSQLHDNVLCALRSLGLHCVSEWRTPDGLFSMDIAVQTGSQNCAPILIDVDGPDHYRRPRDGQTPQCLGATNLRRRLLSNMCGLHVLSLPWWEWEALGGDPACEQRHLQGKIDESRMYTNEKQ